MRNVQCDLPKVCFFMLTSCLLLLKTPVSAAFELCETRELGSYRGFLCHHKIFCRPTAFTEEQTLATCFRVSSNNLNQKLDLWSQPAGHSKPPIKAPSTTQLFHDTGAPTRSFYQAPCHCATIQPHCPGSMTIIWLHLTRGRRMINVLTAYTPGSGELRQRQGLLCRHCHHNREQRQTHWIWQPDYCEHNTGIYMLRRLLRTFVRVRDRPLVHFWRISLQAKLSSTRWVTLPE